MALNDALANVLSQINNAIKVGKDTVATNVSSSIISKVLEIMKDEGYIADFRVDENDGKPNLEVTLKYFEGRGVIDSLKRASRPGLRIYRGKDDLPRVLDGLGIVIVSTSRGFMTDVAARTAGHGGEIICYVA